LIVGDTEPASESIASQSAHFPDSADQDPKALARVASDHAERVTLVGFSGNQKDEATSKKLSHFATPEPISQRGTHQGAKSSKELSHDLAASEPSLPDSMVESQVFVGTQGSTSEVRLGTSPGATSVSGIDGPTITVRGSDVSTSTGVGNDSNTLISAEIVDQDGERQFYLENAQAQILSSAPTAIIVDEVALKKRRKRLVIGGLLLLVAVGVGGLVAGLFATNSTSGNVNGAVSIMPSTSLIPSESPSLTPSAAPTIFSDECIDARVVGSLPFFEPSGRSDLAAELGDDSQALACSLLSGFDRGVWYQIEGDGNCLSASSLLPLKEIAVNCFV
jgi:hypothetical protein